MILSLLKHQAILVPLQDLLTLPAARLKTNKLNVKTNQSTVKTNQSTMKTNKSETHKCLNILRRKMLVRIQNLDADSPTFL